MRCSCHLLVRAGAPCTLRGAVSMRALRLICASLVLTAALARPAEPDLGLPSASWQAGIPWPGSVRAKRGVDLIKAIEDYCRELFKTDPAFAAGELGGGRAGKAAGGRPAGSGRAAGARVVFRWWRWSNRDAGAMASESAAAEYPAVRLLQHRS